MLDTPQVKLRELIAAAERSCFEQQHYGPQPQQAQQDSTTGLGGR